mmetsp:Transcript_9288/g.16171  ORF Transcript_9288/g.16171 Transcript_9288/m.16171 type:complete len:304 (-) Transcript_9288:305-1216(-)
MPISYFSKLYSLVCLLFQFGTSPLSLDSPFKIYPIESSYPFLCHCTFHPLTIPFVLRSYSVHPFPQLLILFIMLRNFAAPMFFFVLLQFHETVLPRRATSFPPYEPQFVKFRLSFFPNFLILCSLFPFSSLLLIHGHFLGPSTTLSCRRSHLHLGTRNFGIQLPLQVTPTIQDRVRLLPYFAMTVLRVKFGQFAVFLFPRSVLECTRIILPHKAQAFQGLDSMGCEYRGRFGIFFNLLVRIGVNIFVNQSSVAAHYLDPSAQPDLCRIIFVTSGSTRRFCGLSLHFHNVFLGNVATSVVTCAE